MAVDWNVHSLEMSQLVGHFGNDPQNATFGTGFLPEMSQFAGYPKSDPQNATFRSRCRDIDARTAVHSTGHGRGARAARATHGSWRTDPVAAAHRR